MSRPTLEPKVERTLTCRDLQVGSAEGWPSSKDWNAVQLGPVQGRTTFEAGVSSFNMRYLQSYSRRGLGTGGLRGAFHTSVSSPITRTATHGPKRTEASPLYRSFRLSVVSGNWGRRVSDWVHL